MGVRRYLQTILAYRVETPVNRPNGRMSLLCTTARERKANQSHTSHRWINFAPNALHYNNIIGMAPLVIVLGLVTTSETQGESKNELIRRANSPSAFNTKPALFSDETSAFMMPAYISSIKNCRQLPALEPAREPVAYQR